MLAENYFTLISKLKDNFDQVTDYDEPVIVACKVEKNTVIVSLDKSKAVLQAIKKAEYLAMPDRG